MATSRTTHGAESGSIPTRTFKDAKSALVNAKRLLDKGEITKADFARLKKKLTTQEQDEDLDVYLKNRYPVRRPK